MTEYLIGGAIGLVMGGALMSVWVQVRLRRRVDSDRVLSEWRESKLRASNTIRQVKLQIVRQQLELRKLNRAIQRKNRKIQRYRQRMKAEEDGGLNPRAMREAATVLGRRHATDPAG